METVLIVLVCCFCSVAEAGDNLVGAASAIAGWTRDHAAGSQNFGIGERVRLWDRPRTLARFPEHKSAECMVRYETEE
jgi:hypothetical protein